MNIFGKLAEARKEFHKLPLEKTGHNRFAGYKYFELSDFLVPAMDCLRDQGLVPVVYFTENFAHMDVHEVDGDQKICICSPMTKAKFTETIELVDNKGNPVTKTKEVIQGADLSGCHPVQNTGAEETYQTRYLWVALLQIVEHDALDATTGSDDEPRQPAKRPTKKVTKKAGKKVAKKVARKSEPKEPEGEEAPVVEIEDEEGAEGLVDFMIQSVQEMHSDDMSNLVSFWKKNANVIDKLDQEYPEQYERLKKVFTETKQAIREKEQNDE